MSAASSAEGDRTGDGPWLVIGLGNPGIPHEGNRHNVGFLVLDVLAARTGGRFKASRRARAAVVEGRLGGSPGGRRVVLAKPATFMNESGAPVAALRDFFAVPLQRIVVVHDELDIPYGALRLKLGGGDNGHNGLKSVRRSMGSGEFHRLRFGIGRPPGRLDPAVFVLRDFSAAEHKDLDFHVDRAADAAEALVGVGLDRAQNVFHT